MQQQQPAHHSPDVRLEQPHTQIAGLESQSPDGRQVAGESQSPDRRQVATEDAQRLAKFEKILFAKPSDSVFLKRPIHLPGAKNKN